MRGHLSAVLLAGLAGAVRPVRRPASQSSLFPKPSTPAKPSAGRKVQIPAPAGFTVTRYAGDLACLRWLPAHHSNDV